MDEQEFYEKGYYNLDFLKIMTLYIGSWSWKLMAIMFLTTGAILVFIGAFGVGLGFMGAFVICSYMSAKRVIQLRRYNEK